MEDFMSDSDLNFMTNIDKKRQCINSELSNLLDALCDLGNKWGNSINHLREAEHSGGTLPLVSDALREAQHELNLIISKFKK